MRICVDRAKCNRHGQCTIAAPDLFRFAADGTMVHVEEIGEAQQSDAMDAADACPEQAITIEA
ncbi:MAG: ferredoxin [Hyphomicrobiaceae bacterium]